VALLLVYNRAVLVLHSDAVNERGACIRRGQVFFSFTFSFYQWIDEGRGKGDERLLMTVHLVSPLRQHDGVALIVTDYRRNPTFIGFST
jgi:hypothetical protein